MHIVVHDYGGYAFPVQLSRKLARRGHHVLHLFSDFVPRKGRLWKEPDDPDTFDVHPISIEEAYQKYDYIQRRRQERAYAKALNQSANDFGPDIILSCNTPIETFAILQKYCRKTGIAYIHWAQDIHTLAIRAVIRRKLPILGSLIALYYQHLEKRVIVAADATIVIADGFVKEMHALGMRPKRVYIIPNWMPLDEMAPAPKVNRWSVEHNLDKTLNIIYIGTLSFKHNETIFIEMAKHFANKTNVRVVVISAGIGFDRLKEQKKGEGLSNLDLLGWQKYEDIANMLAAGDILLSTVTSDASAFSVPCKVLSYLSAGRPVLAAIPEDNLVASILIEEDMGLVAHPDDINAVIATADKLVASAELRARLAANGRAYAKQTFDINTITDRFEQIVAEVRPT
jgi:glycosyltransferase involved in cell wall biosynthesis